MKKVLLFIAMFFGLKTFAQNFTIKGLVVDKTTQKPLDAATIHMENTTDAALISYTISEKNGQFKLSANTKQKEVLLIVSFVGYASEKRKLLLDKKEIDVGILHLKEKATQLQGVEVVGERAPVVVKKDTLEFNADSFKAKNDATVEDLLKQLPGVEVDTDGSIKVNGKNVKEILVNGKPFFGNDPKMATQNLTKDIVNKIQVTDYNSKENKFVGKKEDDEEKSINILLKENKNKGQFGQFTAGYGTDKRYQGSGIFNMFKDTKQFSVLGSSNNISASQGRVVDSKVGVNFAEEYNKQLSFSGNYTFDNAQSDNWTKNQREYLLPNRHYFNSSENSQTTQRNNHRANTRLEFTFKNTFITLSPSFSATDNESQRKGEETSFNENNELINKNNSQSFSENKSRNFSNTLSVNHKFNDKGGSILFRFNNSNGVISEESTIENNRKIQNTTTLERQQETAKGRNDSYGVSLFYRQPIVGKWLLETSYTFRNNEQTNHRDNFSADALQHFSIFNNERSSNFYTLSQEHNSQIGVQYRNDNWFIEAGVGALFTRLFNEDYLHESSIDKNFQNVMLRSRVNYRLSSRRMLMFSYQTRVNNPSVNQLQPIVNVYNPLHLLQGNPNLNREYSHTIFSNYDSFNESNQVSFQSYVRFSATNDKIIQKTITDANLIRTTTYDNVNGNYSLNASISVGKRFRFEKNNISLQLATEYGLNNYKQYSNGELLTPVTQSIRLRPSVSAYIDRWVNIETGYSLGYSQTNYNFEVLKNRTITTQNAYLKTNFTFGKYLLWDNDFSYTYNPSVGGNFQKSFLFWNTSVGVKFNENFTLSVRAYDMLKQNTNAARIISSDYIQDMETTVLKQYFMLNATYKFGVFGGKRLRSSSNFEGERPSGMPVRVPNRPVMR